MPCACHTAELQVRQRQSFRRGLEAVSASNQLRGVHWAGVSAPVRTAGPGLSARNNRVTPLSDQRGSRRVKDAHLARTDME